MKIPIRFCPVLVLSAGLALFSEQASAQLSPSVSSFAAPSDLIDPSYFGVSGVVNGQAFGTYFDSGFQTIRYIYTGSYTPFSVPGASSFSANASDGSTMVGTAVISGSNRIFTYDGSTYTFIAPPGPSTTVSNITGSTIVGKYYSGGGGIYYGFTYSGTYTQIHPPGSSNTAVGGINEDGVVYGDYFNGSKSVGYTYENGVYTYYSPNVNDKYSQIYGVAEGDATLIVGYYQNVSNVYNNFIYNGLTYSSLAVPGATRTYLYGINGESLLYGAYQDSLNKVHGFLYDYETETYTFMDEVLGSATSYVYFDGDSIYGTYTTSGGDLYGYVGAVPEPSTYALLGVGGVGAFFMIRRKKRAASV